MPWLHLLLDWAALPLCNLAEEGRSGFEASPSLGTEEKAAVVGRGAGEVKGMGHVFERGGERWGGGA